MTLQALRISDPRGASGYSRSAFPTWLDLDGNGCDARDDVLAQESVVPVVRNGCDVRAGRWQSTYDATVLTNASDVDIDHVVPLADAWRSGASTWTPERRAAFANDTRDDQSLIAVSASSNRSKGDQPPDSWQPPNRASWCSYGRAWLEVKVQWQLTATTRERDALGQMLETC